MSKEQTRSRGRPAKPLPERIDAPPEKIAEAFLSLPADHEWQFSKTAKRQQPRSDSKA